MSLETGESAEATAAVSTESSSGSGSGYSVTDPGYEMEVASDSVDALAELKAENTKETKPAATAADASDTDSGEPEETVEKPADESADSTEFSDELLDRAAKLEYTVAEIKAFKDPASLEKEISRVEKLQQRLQSRQTKETPVEEATAPVDKPEPDWDALIEAGHDPEIIAMKKEDWKEIQAQKAVINQLMQKERARELQVQSDRFDDSINQLGEEFKAILGTGRIADLEKKSPEIAANRVQVLETMLALRSMYDQSGRTMPPEADLLQAAVNAAFPKQTQEFARNKLKGDIKKAGSQSLSRPHSTGTKPLSGEPKAYAKEQAFWKSKGF